MIPDGQASEESSQGPLNGGKLRKVSHRSLQPDVSGDGAPAGLVEDGLQERGFSVAFLSHQDGLFPRCQGQSQVFHKIPVLPVELYGQVSEFEHRFTSCPRDPGSQAHAKKVRQNRSMRRT